MASQVFLVKSNFIKPAKSCWVSCEALVLVGDTDKILRLKTVDPVLPHNDEDQKSFSERHNPLSFTANMAEEEDIRSVRSGVSSNISSMRDSSLADGQADRPFTVFCNLSQYKQCEIHPVIVNGKAMFAIRLSLSGMIKSKKLYLASHDEEVIVRWSSQLKLMLGGGNSGSKPIKSVSPATSPSSDHSGHPKGEVIITNGKAAAAQKSCNSKSNKSPKKASNKEVAALQKKFSIVHPHMLESSAAPTAKNTTPSHVENLPSADKVSATSSGHGKTADNGGFEDIDETDMMANDIYEPYRNGEILRVEVVPTDHSKRLGIPDILFLKTTKENLELVDVKSERVLHKLPYKYIRRYGSKGPILRLEAGRRCSTGEGLLAFRTSESAQLVYHISQAAKELRAQGTPTDEASSILTLRSDFTLPAVVSPETPSTIGKTTGDSLDRGTPSPDDGQASTSTMTPPSEHAIPPAKTECSTVPPTPPTHLPPEASPSEKEAMLKRFQASVIAISNGGGSGTNDGTFTATPVVIGTESDKNDQTGFYDNIRPPYFEPEEVEKFSLSSKGVTSTTPNADLPRPAKPPRPAVRMSKISPNTSPHGWTSPAMKSPIPSTITEENEPSDKDSAHYSRVKVPSRGAHQGGRKFFHEFSSTSSTPSTASPMSPGNELSTEFCMQALDDVLKELGVTLNNSLELSSTSASSSTIPTTTGPQDTKGSMRLAT